MPGVAAMPGAVRTNENQEDLASLCVLCGSVARSGLKNTPSPPKLGERGFLRWLLFIFLV
jgi:hypothetical protein